MSIQPPERRLVTEATLPDRVDQALTDPDSPAHASLLSTIGTEVPGRVADALADDGTIVNAVEQAVAPALESSFGLVQKLATDIPGVDPTGATDSSAALNAWLAAPDGNVRRLWMPPGTYVGSLRATAPGIVIDAAPGAILKVPDGAVKGDTDAGIRVLADDVTIDGLTIDGNQRGNPHIDTLADAAVADGIGIYANNTTVTNCHIYDPIGHGIIVWGLAFQDTPAGLRSGYLIHGNRIEGGHNRAALDVAFNQGGVGETKGIISNNRITGNTFVLHSANDVVVTGNYAEGMSLHTACERLTVTGNINVGHPLLVQSGKDITLTGNATGTLEVYPGTGTVRPSGITLAANTVTGILNVRDTDGLVLTGNGVRGAVSIDGCTDISFTGGTASRLYVGNITECSDLAIHGISTRRIDLVRAENFLVSGAHVKGGVDGVAVRMGTVERGTYEGGRIYDVTGVGIQLGMNPQVATEVTIQGVTLDTVSAEGVYIGPSGQDTTVADLTARHIGGQEVRDTGVRTVLRGAGKAYGRLVIPPAAVLADAPPTAWPSPNAALFSRFTITDRTTLRYLRFFVGASEGNIQVGVVRFRPSAPTTFDRVMDSGIIPAPAAGIARLDLGTYTAHPGDYGLFLWADSAGFTTTHLSSDVAVTARLTSTLLSIPAGVPVTGTIFEATSVKRALLGACIETDL